MKIDTDLLNEFFTSVQEFASSYTESGYDVDSLLPIVQKSVRTFKSKYKWARGLSADIAYPTACQVHSHEKTWNEVTEMVIEEKRDVTFEEYRDIFFGILTSRYLDTKWEL